MKKSVKTLLALLVLILLTLSLYLGYMYKLSENSLIYHKIFKQSKSVQKAFKKYDIVECTFNLKNPKYAFVSHKHYVYPEDDIDMKLWSVDFYSLFRPNIFSSNWEVKYTGGADINNIDYDSLLEMAKEDCSQFQEDYDNPDSNGIDWGYRKADKEKIKENDELSDEACSSWVESAKYTIENQFTDLQKEKYLGFYGDIYQMNDEELCKVAKKVIDNRGVDESLREYFFDEDGNIIRKNDNN